MRRLTGAAGGRSRTSPHFGKSALAVSAVTSNTLVFSILAVLPGVTAETASADFPKCGEVLLQCYTQACQLSGVSAKCCQLLENCVVTLDLSRAGTNEGTETRATAVGAGSADRKNSDDRPRGHDDGSEG
eukprot:2432822-Rhodomonas_salina.1